MDSKTWVQSTTIYGLAISLIGYALTRIGVDSSFAPALVDALINLSQPVGLVIAAWGRARATGPLKGIS